MVDKNDLEESDQNENQLVINWFPGHMHRTRKLIKSNIGRADMVIEMRDARIPASSCNPMLQGLIKDRPILILLNKADLADEKINQQWINHLRSDQCQILAINSTDTKLRKKMVNACNQLLPNFNKAGRTRIRAMIAGIPNVGKSTLLNTISASSKAKTGNRPAVTVDLQNVRIPGGIDLIDTPGVLWPKIEAFPTGVFLSSVGSIRDEVVDLYQVACNLGAVLLDRYPLALAQRFKIKELPENSSNLIEEIGRRRGFLLSGGVVDIDKAAFRFLTEFRDGKIGRITLEKPND